MNEAYFLIHNCDGETHVKRVDLDEFLRDLADGEYGANPQFLADVPGESDTNYWPEPARLLLRGKVVVPEPVETVVKFRLPG